MCASTFHASIEGNDHSHSSLGHFLDCMFLKHYKLIFLCISEEAFAYGETSILSVGGSVVRVISLSVTWLNRRILFGLVYMHYASSLF